MTDIKTNLRDQYKKGDRIKVAIEGEVTYVGRSYLEMSGPDGVAFDPIFPGDEGVTVEKIEPPVEVFGPGDVVRNSVHTYALTPLGFVVLDEGGAFIAYGDRCRYTAKDFTSPHFERVTL